MDGFGNIGIERERHESSRPPMRMLEQRAVGREDRSKRVLATFVVFSELSLESIKRVTECIMLELSEGGNALTP